MLFFFNNLVDEGDVFATALLQWTEILMVRLVAIELMALN